MAMKHSVYDTDTHFMINPVTRTLHGGVSPKNIVIQYDHNSERFTFEVPRYIEGHDMSLCNIVQVHYNNIDVQTKVQSKGVYLVDDMQISPDSDDVVILSWLISQNATKYVGSLNFLIRFSCVDGDGTVNYAWNTAIYSGVSVSSGIYNSEAVVDQYADVLNDWYQELFGVSDSALNAIVNAETQALGAIETEKEKMLGEIELAADIVQTTGDSETAVMSQNAVTDEISARTANIYNPKNYTPQLGTLNYSAENGHYISSSGTTYFIAIPVESGKEYVLYRTITDSNTFGLAFTNTPVVYGETTERHRFTWAGETMDNVNPYRFVVPEGYTFLVLNVWYSGDTKYTLDEMMNSFYVFDYIKIQAEHECTNEIEDTTFTEEIETTIKEVQDKISSKSFVFAFLSDSHLRSDWEAINKGFENTIKCLTELNKTLSLDAVIHAGDLVNGYEPFEDIRKWNNYAVSKLMGVGAKNVFIAEGNHDGLYRNENDLDTRFTDSQIYSHFHRFNDVNVVRDANPSNYYKDYDSHKLRIVIMDNAIGYATDTVTWLSGVLGSTPDNYKIVVFTHCPPRPSISFDGDDLTNYEQIESVMQTHADKIIGHFYGHTHCDNVTYGNGYAEISIACSQPYREIASVPDGATTVPTAFYGVGEQCFDIVCVLPNEGKFELIRFGGGNNHTVPFVQ